MEPQKPVDPSQVKLEKSGSVPAPSSGSSCTGGGGGMMCMLLKAFFVLFVLGNVTALYILHFVNRPSPTTRFTFENFAATANTSPQEGDAVSLSTSSALRNGAGTTAYLNQMQLSGADWYEYINLAPLGTTKKSYSTNLMSYSSTTGSTITSVLTTVAVGNDKSLTPAATVAGNTISGEHIRGIATLSDSIAVVLSVAPYVDATSTYSGYVTTVMLDGSASTASLMATTRIKASDYSIANYIAPLPGQNAFVFEFYDKYDATSYSQKVKVGLVDPTTHMISFTPEVSFGPANVPTSSTQAGKPTAVGTAGAFIIPYYTTSTTTPSGLCVTKSTFSASTSSVAAFSTPVCNTKFTPTNLVESIMVSDSVLAIAFYDKANNNALTIATVSVSANDGSLRFRSSYVLAEVSGSFEFGTVYGYSPKPSLATLTGDRLVVSFLNPSASGKLSVKILQFSSETLAFKDVTPVLPLAKTDFTLVANSGSAKAVTVDVLPVSADGVMTGYIGFRGVLAHQFFSVVEDFGTPVGILRKYTSKSKKAVVAITGKAEVSGGLTVGQIYFAMTTGALSKASATATTGSQYVYSADGKCLMTADSKVGIAVDKEHLFVNTAL